MKNKGIMQDDLQEKQKSQFEGFAKEIYALSEKYNLIVACAVGEIVSPDELTNQRRQYVAATIIHTPNPIETNLLYNLIDESLNVASRLCDGVANKIQRDGGTDEARVVAWMRIRRMVLDFAESICT